VPLPLLKLGVTSAFWIEILQASADCSAEEEASSSESQPLVLKSLVVHRAGTSGLDGRAGAYLMGVLGHISWVCCCISHGCAAGYLMGVLQRISWVCCCVSHGCAAAYLMGVLGHISWVCWGTVRLASLSALCELLTFTPVLKPVKRDHGSVLHVYTGVAMPSSSCSRLTYLPHCVSCSLCPTMVVFQVPQVVSRVTLILMLSPMLYSSSGCPSCCAHPLVVSQVALMVHGHKAADEVRV